MVEGKKGSLGQSGAVVTIGSAADNDVIVDEAMVSGHHAHLLWDGERLLIEDLGSTNGTSVNGQRVVQGPVALGDKIGLGSHRLTLTRHHLRKFRAMGLTIPGLTSPEPVKAPATEQVTKMRLHTMLEMPINLEGAPSQSSGLVVDKPVQNKTAQPGQLKKLRKAWRGADLTIPPGAESLTLGYADDNDIVVPMPQVSGHHCRLWRVGQTYYIEDLGSTNGTWVRGERVARAQVFADEMVGLGSYMLRLTEKLLGSQARRDRKATSEALPRLGKVSRIRIGRDSAENVNDIVIDAPMVSSRHCELKRIETGWSLRDLGSTNGTYVNSNRNRVTETNISDADVIFLGSYRLPMSRLADLLPGVEGVGDGTLRLQESRDEFVIGRDEGCDLTINVPKISRRHARLQRRADGTFLIQDLGSANGTFVEGERVRKPTVVHSGEVISLGGYQLRLDGASGSLVRNYHGDIMIQADGVSVKVDRGRKTILHNVSFTVYPTEFVGLMGPSGAGKTTLMMALNGYLPPSQGRSMINGTDLYKNYDAYRGNIGYVPQDDIIHRELTVFEALYYTAKLRLPPDTRDEEIRQIIHEVLVQLEIENTRDVIIGSPEQKGISGGQRKRVNLAQELLTQPSLLFLDEPTSGLAAGDTLNVMKLLRRLADEGRTILLTIHQPSLEAYRTMDNIVYLADGHLVYYGPAYPDSILYFNPGVEPGTPEGDRVLSDPGNALVPLDDDRRRGFAMANRARDYIDSGYFQQFVHRRSAGQGDAIIASDSRSRATRRLGLRQWWILTRRLTTIKLKDVTNTAILLIQAPVIAAIIALVFTGEIDDSFGRVNYSPFALFMMAISAVWFGCSNAAREIVSEQAVYRRERMVNLKIASYVMSKFTVLGVICAVQCAILLAITWLSLGLQGNLFEMFLILYLCSTAGVGMGLTLSATVRSSEAAVALVPLLLIPQVILAGLVMPVDRLSAPMQTVSATMMTRWGFEALLHAEDRQESFEIDEGDIQRKQDELVRELREQGGADNVNFDAMPEFPVPDHPLDRYFDHQEVGTAGDLGVLFLFNLMMIFGVMIILKVRDPAVQ